MAGLFVSGPVTPDVAFGDTPADALHGGQGAGVKVIGHNDLRNTIPNRTQGLNGHVDVLGDYAYVGYGDNGGTAFDPSKTPTCNTDQNVNLNHRIKIVSLVDPTNPTVVAEIQMDSADPTAAGAINTVARDVDVMHMSTPFFTGDVLAVALESCSRTGAGAVGVNFYDVTNPATPALLGRDDRFFGNTATRQVSLVQRPDGRVLAVLADGGGLAGGIHVTDVTNPRAPAPVGVFDQPNGAASKKECWPFSFAQGASTNVSGSRAYAAYQDSGLYVLDLDNLLPVTNVDVPNEIGVVSHLGFPDSDETNSLRYVPNAAETVALATDDDLLPTKTTLTVTSGNAASYTEPGGTTAGVFRGCESLAGEPLWEQATPSVTTEVVFVNNGCRSTNYPANIGGKIALAVQGGTNADGTTCFFDDKARMAQDPDGNPATPGAVALLIQQSAADHHAAGGTGVLRSAQFSGNVDANVNIPVVNITKEAGDQISASRFAGQTVNATLADNADKWGALRVIDLAGAGGPSQVTTFHSPHSNTLPPATMRKGLFNAVQAEWDGDRALVAWMSDGLRVVDVSNAASPKAGPWYVPPAVSDPTGNFPTVPLVVDTAKFGANRVVITDINGGLYVLNVIRNPGQCAGGGHADYGFSSESACLGFFETDVAVTKSDSPDPVTLGEELTYTVTATNNGPNAAAAVTVNDTLPASVSFVSASASQGSCTQSAGTVTCSLGNLGSGSSATATIVVEPNVTGTVTNTATVSAANNDTNTANNSASASTTVNNTRGCTVIGTGGDDVLTGTAGDDVICGLGGNDTITGLAGFDTLIGGSGTDTLNGGNDGDRLEGGKGNDIANGDNANDVVIGGAGADTLNGGNGDDSLDGVDGVMANDSLDGAGGTDTCTADVGDVTLGCP